MYCHFGCWPFVEIKRCVQNIEMLFSLTDNCSAWAIAIITLARQQGVEVKSLLFILFYKAA